MESGGIMFNREHTGYNSNSNNPDWEQIWELNAHPRFDLCTSNKAEAATDRTQHPAGDTSQALFYCCQSLYAGGGSNLHPDPHLVCLKLGKRQYFEDATTAPTGERRVPDGFTSAKKGKPNYDSFGGAIGASSSRSPLLVTAVPRCQVEGCLAPLTNAKDYHRRHKVCEVHSKASRVMVLGLEQRFCQQCSRFHVSSEFDESKRSCRRRLAGHNERRRKSSHDSLPRNSTQGLNKKLMPGATCPSPTGRALSLLSSNKPKADDYSCLISSSDLSSRCSAALGELIAENRAAILARHVLLYGHARDWRHYQHQMLTDQHNWGLDLMQPPSKELRFFSTKGKTNNYDEGEEEEEDCSEFWSSLEGDHAV